MLPIGTALHCYHQVVGADCEEQLCAHPGTGSRPSCIFADRKFNGMKLRKKCQICVSELAALEHFSEQGEGLLAPNTESSVCKCITCNFQNALQALNVLGEDRGSFYSLSLLFIMVL